jgi:hypothetical protein
LTLLNVTVTVCDCPAVTWTQPEAPNVKSGMLMYAEEEAAG